MASSSTRSSRRKPVDPVDDEPDAFSDQRSEKKTAYLLRQVSERLAISLTEALRPFNQTASGYRVLIALTRRDHARMRDLIELTLVESSTLSRTIGRMEAQELVTVEQDDDDGRAVIISITQAGRDLLDAMLPAVSAQYEWSVHDVPPADLEILRTTLQRMLRNLKISPIK